MKKTIALALVLVMSLFAVSALAETVKIGVF